MPYKDPEKGRKRKREYYLENKPALLARKKQYRLENKEAIQLREQEYRVENRDIIRLRRKEARDSEQDRAYWLNKKYGLTVAEYEAMKANQPACAICSSAFDGDINIDHCHETGKVRGLLCMTCNILLGYYEKIQKTPDLTVNIERYLNDQGRSTSTSREVK